MFDKKDQSILILFSGGIDSTALVHYYLQKGFNVKCLHIQYGQKTEKSEQNAVQELAKYYNIELTIYKLGVSLNTNHSEYIFRNSLFINLAAGTLPKNINKIALGIHAGVPYYDCSEKFISDIQKIVDGYFAGTVLIEAPFIGFGKQDIYKYCIENKIPIEKTYSCENNEVIPCGYCLSCRDRGMLDGDN
jgi:7-cyano-7-deazaguanine synthase